MGAVGALLLKQYSANKASITKKAWAELATYKWKEAHYMTNLVNIEQLMRLANPNMEDEIKVQMFLQCLPEPLVAEAEAKSEKWNKVGSKFAALKTLMESKWLKYRAMNLIADGESAI